MLAAGCMGSDGERISATELQKLVLQPADVPRGLIQFDEGPQRQADAPEGARSDPERFGRVNGWKARYRRLPTLPQTGPLVVESRADLFETVEGARQDFELLAAPGGLLGTRVDAPEVGDESLAAALEEAGGVRGVRSYTVAWRDANATASVLVSGFAPTLTLEDAVRLARRQQRRIGASAR